MRRKAARLLRMVWIGLDWIRRRDREGLFEPGKGGRWKMEMESIAEGGVIELGGDREIFDERRGTKLALYSSCYARL